MKVFVCSSGARARVLVDFLVKNVSPRYRDSLCIGVNNFRHDSEKIKGFLEKAEKVYAIEENHKKDILELADVEVEVLGLHRGHFLVPGMLKKFVKEKF